MVANCSNQFGALVLGMSQFPWCLLHMSWCSVLTFKLPRSQKVHLLDPSRVTPIRWVRVQPTLQAEAIDVRFCMFVSKNSSNILSTGLSWCKNADTLVFKWDAFTFGCNLYRTYIHMIMYTYVYNLKTPYSSADNDRIQLICKHNCNKWYVFWPGQRPQNLWEEHFGFSKMYAFSDW